MTRVLEFGAPLRGSVQQSLAVHTKVAVISANLRVVVCQSYSHTHRLDHRSCNLSEVQQVSSNHRVNRQVSNNQDPEILPLVSMFVPAQRGQLLRMVKGSHT